MKSFLWIISLGASVIAGLLLWSGLSEAENAVQEGAVAAVSAAVAIIPYCVARAVGEMVGEKEE